MRPIAPEWPGTIEKVNPAMMVSTKARNPRQWKRERREKGWELNKEGGVKVKRL